MPLTSLPPAQSEILSDSAGAAGLTVDHDGLIVLAGQDFSIHR